MSLAYKVIESPVGKLKLVASDNGLVAILWENDNPRRVKLTELLENERHPILVNAEQQLGEYFSGKRNSFSVVLDMRGTRFQKDVWEALLAIPFGETRSYSQLRSDWEIRGQRARWVPQTEEIHSRSSCPAIG
jgi:methylated-DNA-[protein]-cysteine S-methyltransferase